MPRAANDNRRSLHRRELIALAIGALILFFGVVIMPLCRAMF
jgi:hypothetical protein